MKPILYELLASKKFLMAILAMIAAGAAHWGWQLDPTQMMAFLSPLIAAIIGQGIADHGKSAAQVKMRARAARSSSTPDPTPPAGGMQAASAIAVIALAVMLGGGAAATQGCTRAQTAVASGGSAFLKCNETDLTRLVNGQTLVAVVASDLLSGNYAAAISDLIAKIGEDEIGCAVIAIDAIAEATTAGSGAGSGSSSPSTAMPSPLQLRARELIKAHAWKAAPAAVPAAVPAAARSVSARPSNITGLPTAPAPVAPTPTSSKGKE